MTILPGHNAKTCPCVGCRVARGERPNPGRTSRGCRARSYLWLSDAVDEAITHLARRDGLSKAAVVRQALDDYLFRSGLHVSDGDVYALDGTLGDTFDPRSTPSDTHTDPAAAGPTEADPAAAGPTEADPAAAGHIAADLPFPDLHEAAAQGEPGQQGVASSV